MRRLTEGFIPAARISSRWVLLALLLAGCSSILDVKNPNSIAESSLTNPASADAQSNGVIASVSRALSGLSNVYAVTTDELDWIGSRDAYRDLDTGGIGNYINEYTDGAFPLVGEARYLGDAAIQRLEDFDKAGLLKNRASLARAYLYTAVIYATIADVFDDFAFSNKTVPATPVGRANMGKLYDVAVGYLGKALAIAVSVNDNTLRYQITAYQARVKHGKAVWALITPKGQTPANPLVNDAGAVADATAALALAPGDAKFNLLNNLEATAGINIWFEVNGRNENALGRVYKALVDPLTGAKDVTTQAILAGFTAFGTQSGTFTLTSHRELRLILAEAALAAGNTVEFTNQLNAARAFDSKPAYTGQIPAIDMLKFERQAQLLFYRRRLADMYRFGQKAAEWTSNPNFDSSFSVPGLLFPIPNVERLANPCIAQPTQCK